MKCLGSKLLSVKVKCLVYKTTVVPMVRTCGAETGAVCAHGENVLRFFETEVLCKIFGTALEYQCWRGGGEGGGTLNRDIYI